MNIIARRRWQKRKLFFLSFYFQMNFLVSFANALSSPLSNWSGTNTENVIGGKTLSSYFLTSKKKREKKSFVTTTLAR